jgi:glyoxylase-like metal-dependent hydrolase (beta-lactamase superfamily II)
LGNRIAFENSEPYNEIRNEKSDGWRYLLMSTTVFSSRPICTNTWIIKGEGCTSYLVVGDKRGVLIDTGYALENIQKFAQSLTDVPVMWAANTHGHFDHTGGNGWFERAYMSAKALEIAKIPYPSKTSLPYPLDYVVTVVGDGDRIELGGRDLEVIEIPAHAPSSIAFLDKKERILFSGDEIAKGVMLYWQQPEPQPTVEQHARNIEKLLKHRKEFDFICSGHGEGLDDTTLIDVLLEHDHWIMAGNEGKQFEMKRIETDDLDKPAPEDLIMYQIEYKRASTYKETFIGYDLRYVHNKRLV